MKLSKNFKKLLVEELETVIHKMEASDSPQEAIYYFSAIHGAIQRVFNFEYHDELVHLWTVINPLFEFLNQKLNRPPTPWDNTGLLFLSKAIELVVDLKEALKENKDTSSLAREFAVLQYATTGNGLYLYNKGKLKLK